VHAEHLLAALRITLDETPPPRRPLVWQFHFADDRAYTLRADASGWTLTHGIDDATPDVVVTTDTHAWTRFLMTPPEQRPSDPPDIELHGRAGEIDRFLQHLAHFPYAMSTNGT
jgi:hypothetical protein